MTKAPLFFALLAAFSLAFLSGCVSSGSGGAGGGPHPEIGCGANGTCGNATPAAPETLSGLDFARLSALGFPVSCNATIGVEGDQVVVDVKVLGPSYMERVGAYNNSYTRIVKGGMTYREMDPGADGNPAGCAWIEMDAGIQGSLGQDDELFLEIERLPASRLSCVRSDFGSEAFATPGKVCGFKEFFGGAGTLPP